MSWTISLIFSKMNNNSISKIGENTKMLRNIKPCRLQIKFWHLTIVMTANGVEPKSSESKITARSFHNFKKVPIFQTLSTIICNQYFCMVTSEPSLKCQKWALNCLFYLSQTISRRTKKVKKFFLNHYMKIIKLCVSFATCTPNQIWIRSKAFTGF